MTDTTPSTSTKPEGRTLTIIAFVLAGLALLFGLLAAIPALVCAVIAQTKGDPLAKWAIVASIIGAIAGAFIGIAVLDAVN